MRVGPVQPVSEVGIRPGNGAWPALRWVAGERGVGRESPRSVRNVCAHRAEQGGTRFRSLGNAVPTREASLPPRAHRGVRTGHNYQADEIASSPSFVERSRDDGVGFVHRSRYRGPAGTPSGADPSTGFPNGLSAQGPPNERPQFVIADRAGGAAGSSVRSACRRGAWYPVLPRSNASDWGRPSCRTAYPVRSGD